MWLNLEINDSGDSLLPIQHETLVWPMLSYHQLDIHWNMLENVLTGVYHYYWFQDTMCGRHAFNNSHYFLV